MAMIIEGQDFELNLLRTFLAVAQHGSMGRTAAAIAKTQPAVSQQMLRLERVIGRKLFCRSRNGVKLTSHGELLVTYADRAINLNAEALAQLREFDSVPLGPGVNDRKAFAGRTHTPKRVERTEPDVELRNVVGAATKREFLLTRVRGLVELALTTSIEVAAGTRPVHSREGPLSDEDCLPSGSRLLELGVAGPQAVPD
jgi:DNA-binding transcriptional LysR family regulator